MIHRLRRLGSSLLVLGCVGIAGCGADEEVLPAPPTQPPASTPAMAPSEAPSEAPTPPAPVADKPPTHSRIQFVEGFQAGAAKAQPGDILFVYVGLHNPT